ncbi:mitochondrial metalloendopeptidase OMA1-like [Triticum aestivum]|uniref:mitochondrial metalloendopeptidase OMA1-like n=1 Tax=Triticum aestivum TaxID=4565 RepID=UPI00084398E0|nr:mitochondrial metalloendopeptidase OMA1-like [Triticum aestivum]XP_044445596.1 mitochondrial metalloendopeptidase OMA1-like [Triticum aestivum]XP_044445601.1 mitochondrial metalloendopeptidase OMA1-like [Triticum aestivum]XP_044446764.1 mitochondrial metalloendopeptidase OMA1-like [Triticum aestivum]XP_044446801.1 mitochondrial metalloendopeptidase OMA1-like [Triticum aestivum]
MPRNIPRRLLLCTNNLHCRLGAVQRRFFSHSDHVKRPPPSPPEAPPWHHDPRKVAAATALATGVAAIAVRLKYGERAPFSGRTHLALFSHEEARERDEAEFAKFKKEHASRILGPRHPDTVRVRGIALDMVRAAHHGLAVRQLHVAKQAKPRSDELQWMDGLHWEVIVVRDDEINGDSFLRDGKKGAETFAGAGKIVVYTALLHPQRSEAEIAFTLAHEVGHVIARHSSGIIHWLSSIIEKVPILFLLVLPFMFPVFAPFKRRCELEADHIGILLLAAAGVDPVIAVQVMQENAMLRGESTLQECLSYFKFQSSAKKRWQFLSQPKVFLEALELYKQVTSHAQG